MKKKPSTVEYHSQSVSRILEIVETDSQKGLDHESAGRRLKKYGPNKLRGAKARNTWKIFFDQFKSMVIIVLVIAGTLALLFGHWTEGIAIAAVIFINAVIGFLTEKKAVASMKALRSMSGDSIRVRRNGEEREIDSEHLVPGDIMFLEAGYLVPADARLIEANRIRVNESTLTGESVPVHKQVEPVSRKAVQADRLSMVYKGTTLTEGSGEAVVTGTGMNTQLGKISTLAQEAEKETTPLQKRLDQLGRRLAWITLILAAMIAAAGLAAGRETFQMIETSIALGVAAIPEGLPIVSTIALARGMYLMAQRNALVNKLPAVETLGATEVIFTDKTGTLTENRMTLQRIITPEGDFSIDENRPFAGNENKPSARSLQRILRIGVLCNNAVINSVEEEGDVKSEQGDPTETALLRAGRQWGMERSRILENMPELREIPFDADNMMMATCHGKSPDDQDNNQVLFAVKGAPQKVMKACSRILSDRGDREQDFSEDMREKWVNKTESLAGEGYRVLAMAEKTAVRCDERPYETLCLLGIVGLTDPPRKDVRESIEECKKAGIRVVMVTGDKAATAGAVGSQTGIADADKPPLVIHGNEIKDPDEMSGGERRHILQANIFARVSPEQKLDLIRLVQAEERVAAMTGDGVNDAPALKKADIGIAMGQRGTDAAREVADMVLNDDAFSSITAAVRQGRIIFDNIRKSVMFMLCTNVAEVLAVGLAAVIGEFASLPIPLLPLQILYLNVITDVFPALALGMGKGSDDIMERRPRPKHEAVLTRTHWLTIAGWAGLISICVLAGLSIAVYYFDFDHHRAVTISFLTLAFAKLWFVFNLRDPGTRLFANDLVQNPYIHYAIVLCTGLLIAAVYLPGLSHVLKTRHPGAEGWALLLGMSMVPFIVGQSLRIMQRIKTT